MSAALKICGYPVHPAARLLPPEPEERVRELAESIRENGQREEIVLLDGQILDGCTRGRSCELLGISPRTREATREESARPYALVVDLNLRRRHLNESQRALVGTALLPLLEEEARQRQAAALKKGPSAPQGAHGAAPRAQGKSAAIAAKAVGVSTRTLERAGQLVKKAPAPLLEAVRSGDKTVKQAERELRTAEQIKQVRAYVPPKGKYPVITVDPPWEYDDKLDGSDQIRGGCPYPTMTLEEICGLKIPAADDCVLFLWITNAHLVAGAHVAVLKAWGFNGKTLATWGKDRMGGGRWLRGKTEHVILAVKGKPKVDLTNETTLFPGKVTTHSTKPPELYSLVESLCPASPRLEMFARGPREGWVTTGAEAPGMQHEADASIAGPALISGDRFKGEAVDLGFTAKLVWSGTPRVEQLLVKCGLRGCRWDHRAFLNGERLVSRAQLKILRRHQRESHAGGVVAKLRRRAG